MKHGIEKRLHALEALAKESNNGLFTAVYKDGRRRILTPLEALAVTPAKPGKYLPLKGQRDPAMGSLWK